MASKEEKKNDATDVSGSILTTKTDAGIQTEHEGSRSKHSQTIYAPDLVTVGEYNYEDVDKMMEKFYNPDYQNNSTILDILAVYMKGQKIIYSEAKTYCEQYLNLLMLPSIFITVLGSVLNLILKESNYGVMIVSSLNGFTAFLLALINYLKLDAKAEAHRTTAYKFDKLESSVVFNSGKALFLNKTGAEMEAIIKEAENNVKEIKETNQFILPESIRYNYPSLCNINVFAEAKKIVYKEMRYKNDLKNIINDRIHLEGKRDKTTKELDTLDQLKLSEKEMITDIIRLKNDYLDIDRQFEKEMKNNRLGIKNKYYFCGCLKS